MNSIDYNKERKIQNEWARKDFDVEKAIEEVHKETLDIIQQKIDRHYINYANQQGLTLAEARKKIKDFDVPSWADKAAKTVDKAIRDKLLDPQRYKANKKNLCDYFSPETNDWLKTYNRKMYISRLEYMQAEIEIDLQRMYAQDHVIIQESLINAYLDETKRQAGILGQSATGHLDRVQEVLNADFYGNSFSEKVWGRNGQYEKTRQKVFGAFMRMHSDISTFKQERRRLQETMQVTKYEANRLMYTEMNRMRMIAEKDMYDQAEADYYTNIPESSACPHCARWQGIWIKREEMEIGVNAPPFHPNCRCHTKARFKLDRKDGTSNIGKTDGYKRNKHGIIVADTIINGHESAPKTYKPFSVVDRITKKGFDTRTYYDSRGLKIKDITPHNHNNSKHHNLGFYGEHAHNYYWDQNGKLRYRSDREINEIERKENRDIL